MHKIKVFHLEDYKILRDGVRFFLSQDDEIELVGGSKNPDDLFRFLNKEQVDVLLLDIFLDGMEDVQKMNGFDICARIAREHPNIKILAHSIYDDAEKISRIINAGGYGFVSKKAGYEELIYAIKKVYSGKKYICTESAKRLKNLNRFLAGIEESLKSDDDFFSNREREVLQLLAQGYSTREIAASLFITEKTVESHRKNMVDKAKVKNTVELVAYAISRGVIKT